MIKVKDIYDYLSELAPTELQMDFDNAGFLVGHSDAELTKVIVALDITEAVIDEAVKEKAELIVSHHPVIFHDIRRITDEASDGKKILSLCENRIAAICMHTNLDIAEGGVNDVLIELLGAECESPLDAQNCGRIGRMRSELSFGDFLALCKDKLNANGLRYYNAGKPVRRLAVMGGAGADEIKTAFDKGCDTYVTADIKYHQFQLGEALGINLVDADHFCTENPVVAPLAEKLQSRFPEVSFKVSEVHRQLVCFY